MKRLAVALFAFGSMCSCQFAFSTIGSWTRQEGPPAPITTNNVVALPDGRVAIFGGLSLQTGQESAQTVLYDPVHNTWTSGAPMPGPAFPDVVTALRDGIVLVEGGLDTRTGNMSGATWLYDLAGNSWSRAGDLLEPRSGPSFTVLTDGRVIIAGGAIPLPQPQQQPNGSQEYQDVTSAEIFDPQSRSWSQAGRLPTARGGIAIVPLPGGGALAAGGCIYGNVFPTPGMTTVDLFDPGTSTWSPTTPLPAPICAGAAVALRDGRVLLLDRFGNSSNGAFLYDPKSRAWCAAGALAGGGTSALELSDGRVFVPEVQPGAPEGHIFKDLVGGQIFDPATNEWTYVTTTSVPLPLVYLYSGGQQISVALPDGSAVVILQTVALAFHPQVAPPATQLLDSTGFTTVLVAIAVVIGLLMLLAYRRAGRTGLGKLG